MGSGRDDLRLVGGSIPRKHERTLTKNSDMATEKSKNSDLFSKRLLVCMEKSGISKAQMARELGVSNAHVANWIAGQLPRAEQILTIAERFGVTIEWLIRGNGSPPAISQSDNCSIKQAKAEAENLARLLGEAESSIRRLRSFLG